MGNVCSSKGGVPPPTSNEALPEEPMLGMDLPAITDKLLNEKAAEVGGLIEQVSALQAEGKSLASQFASGGARISDSMSQVSTKVTLYKQKRDLGKKGGEGFPLHTVEYFRQKRTEIEELIQLLVKLRFLTVLQYEPGLKSIVERVAVVEATQSGIASLLTRARQALRIPKNLTLKTTKIEENIQKLVQNLNELHADIRAIREMIDTSQANLSELPAILSLLKELILIDPNAAERGEVGIEEVVACVEEGEVVVEEGRIESEVWEEEVAAEAQEVDITKIFDFGDENKNIIRLNAIWKVYEKNSEEKRQPMAEEDVYRLIFSALESKSTLDLSLASQPLPTDLYFLHHILKTYPRSPILSLLAFLDGFKAMLQAKKPFAQFFADWIGIFTERPLSRPVATLVPILDSLLGQAIEEGNAKREIAYDAEKMDEEGKKNFMVNRGFVHVSDVANLVYARLNDWPQFVGRTLEKLRPSHIEEADFLHFLIVHRMKSQDIDAISLYKSISDSAGQLKRQRFLSGMRQVIQMHLSPEALQCVYKKMKSPDRPLIHRVDFIRFVRLWAFQKQEAGGEMVTGRNAALEAITEAYCGMRVELMLSFYPEFHRNADRADRIRLDQLEPTIRLLGETRDVTNIIQSWKKDKVTFQDFVELLEKYGLEPYHSRFFRWTQEKKPVEDSVPDQVTKLLKQ